MVRGFHDRIYYAETCGTSQKIQQVELHSTLRDRLIKKDIFTLAGS